MLNLNSFLSGVRTEWERLVEGEHVNKGKVGNMVLDSWMRCRGFNLDPWFSKLDKLLLRDKELERRREENSDLLRNSRPFMHLLYESVKGSGFVVILTDSEGYILEMFGDKEEMEMARGNYLVPGANRSEEVAGTNAIGLAITYDKPVQLVGPEHYNKNFHRWTCTAAPIHDSGGMIQGILNLSGYYKRAHRHTYGMVNSIVEAIEREQVLNDRMFSILEAYPGGVVALNGKGNIFHLNDQAAESLAVGKHSLEQANEIFTQNPELMEMAKNIKGEEQERELVVRTPRGSRHFSVRAYPVNTNRVNPGNILTFRRLSKTTTGTKENSNDCRYTFDDIAGESDSLKKVVNFARKVARTRASVLIEGESGTGKELFAQAIHNESDRKDHPFIPINCGAIPRELIESELFGYEEGAFSGARKGGRRGKFELAQGGTIFLDEIGDLPPDLQVKLLRAVEEQQIIKVGGEKPVKLDIRIISATNKKLEDEIAEEKFRLDLYYRLNEISIKLPPLRERMEDIRVLIPELLESISEELSWPVPEISSGAFTRLLDYHWPGNVRELENVLRQAVILSEGEQVTPAHLMIARSKQIDSIDRPSEERSFLLRTLEETKQRAAEEALRYTGGNVSKAAKILGVSRNTIYKIMGQQKCEKN